MSTIKKLCSALSLLLAAILASGSLSFAGEIDILVDKLVEKGVLTKSEAQEILTETKEEIKAQMAKGELDTVPSWVQNTKIKGDIRTRYQWDKRKGSGNQNERARTRFRIGVDSKVNEKANAHLQLATGSRSDLRSTNQTWGGNSNEAFGHWDIWIDQAYMDYTAFPWLTLIAGKMPIKSAIWQTGDMLFDTDINPEGGMAAVETALSDNVSLFANTGWMVMQDGSQNADVTMAYIQPGVAAKLGENAKLKLVAGYLQYNSLKGKDLDTSVSTKSSDTNSTDAAGGLKYDFNSWIANAELGISNPFVFLPSIPYFAVFGDYVNNTDPSSENDGFLAGFKFGEKKVKEFGQWEGKYMYREIGKDAVLDIFPDSDALSGKTDIKSHELAFTYGLGKNMTFGLDYYISQRLKDISSGDSKEHLVQADVVYKF
ncbi:MAG: putative porin [Candidatus Omnitrophica bacterium]|nr:putative porin [Candidatus Omnitrophota bacterium]